MGSYTLAEKGAKQVPIAGSDDKREITALLAVSMAGDVLPLQLIYTGTTERSHPTEVAFPNDWDITHSKNHWSTEETMLRYIDKIIDPYMKRCRHESNLPEDQKGLCIFDVFAAHRCESVEEKLKSLNIEYVFVPASCTGELQVLDLTVNSIFKRSLKESFALWYSQQVEEEIGRESNESLGVLKLQLSIMKPIHARWIIEAISHDRDFTR